MKNLLHNCWPVLALAFGKATALTLRLKPATEKNLFSFHSSPLKVGQVLALAFGKTAALSHFVIECNHQEFRLQKGS